MNPDGRGAIKKKQNAERLRAFHDGWWYGVIPFSLAFIILPLAIIPGTTRIIIPIASIALAAVGLFMLRKWAVHKAKTLRYLPFLKPRGVTTLSSVAAANHETIEETTKSLLELINRQFFDNAYIDYDEKLFVVSAETTSPGTCPSCGASWVVTTGIVDRCPFCGTFLEDKKEPTEVNPTAASAPSISERIAKMNDSVGHIKERSDQRDLSLAEHSELDSIGHNADEMIGVIKWLTAEQRNMETFGGDIDKDGLVIYKIRMNNRSGLDFKEFSSSVLLTSVTGKEEPATLSISHWKNGTAGDLYFKSSFSPRMIYKLSLDVNNIRYTKE